MKSKYTAKVAFLSLLICIGVSLSSKAQVIAGTLPSGGYIINPNMNFSIANDNEDTTGAFDLNCDNIPDISFQLIRGQVSIDGANSIFLYVHNPVYSICSDTNSFSIKQVNFYSMGDIMNCTSSFGFTNDTIYKLGDYGCFGCMGPWSIFEKYIAWNDGVNTGWIKVTFDLLGSGGAAPITFSSNEYLTYCNPNAIDEMINGSGLTILPNPTMDGVLKLEYKGVIKSVDVFNSVGQKLNVVFDGAKLTLPAEKGVYILTIKDSSGKFMNRKVIRD